MNYLYPDRIADDYDDELSSCCSAEIEGGVVVAADPRTPSCSGAVNPTRDEAQQQVGSGGGSASDRRDGSAEGGNSGSSDGSSFESSEIGQESSDESHVEEDALKDAQDTGGNRIQTASNGTTNDQDEKNNPMATLIQHERNRRLGIRESAIDINNTDADNKNTLLRSKSEIQAAPASGGVLGNIRGWFGGGGAVGIGTSTRNVNQSVPFEESPTSPSRRSSAPAINASSRERKGSEVHDASELDKHISYNEDDEDSSSGSSDESSSDDDDSSSSQSSNATSNNGDAALTPQERARARALRYLSNSCVDAGRKVKTASYVRGLERLDLKRKRDRYEKELEIVESEMNKDRGLISGGERDAISAMAAKLVRELPRIQGADAGAGSDLGMFMSYDEYAALNIDNGGPEQQPSLWENKEGVDVYVTSLQSRLKVALERTRALEKRLVVLEQAGDDIVSSLCEDLAEITGSANKAEARYVKKGKELQRRRRREELRNRTKIKQAERRVRRLEEQLMVASGVRKLEGQLEIDPKTFLEITSDTSNEDSTLSGDNDEENDEILLEKKLTSIKAKNGQDRNQHESEVGSIRRQCEQLKLRLSVARLVMEGDDNLREYMALLERLNPSTRALQRKSSTFGEFDDEDASGIHGPIPSPPPSRITRARAKLLKVTHLERIYGQRLAVSKAFTDATINALDQELVEREESSQKMEVRCLNELVLIDSVIKDIAEDDKLSELEFEANGLEDAVAACNAQEAIANVNGMFNYALMEPPKPSSEEAIPADNESSSDTFMNEKVNGMQHVETYSISNADSSLVKKDGVDECESFRHHQWRPTNSGSSSDKSIDDTDDVSQHLETGLTLDADSSQIENNDALEPNDALESEPTMHVEGEPNTIDNESSHESLTDQKGNDEEQVNTGLMSDNDASRDSLIHEKDSNYEQAQKCLVSDAGSVPIENDAADKSSLPDNSMVKAPLSADIDADSIEATPCEDSVGVNHDIGDFRISDEAMENGDHDKIVDYQFSNETPQNEDDVKTESNSEAEKSSSESLETDSMDRDFAAIIVRNAADTVPHSEEQEWIPQNLQSEMLLPDQVEEFSATKHSLAGNVDGIHETASEIHTNVDRELGSDHIKQDGAKKVEQLSAVGPEKTNVLEMLGNELKYTLAEYQTSFDLSSSSQRVGQLEYMNDLVLKIAKERGIECPNNGASGESEFKSSFKISSFRSGDKKKRSKKKKKKRRRHAKERKERKDELDLTLDGLMDGARDHDQSPVW